MTLLYRIHDEIAIEMGGEAWRTVEHVIREALLTELFPVSRKDMSAQAFAEIECFVNAIRAHLQHVETIPRPPVNNLDLV